MMKSTDWLLTDYAVSPSSDPNYLSSCLEKMMQIKETWIYAYEDLVWLKDILINVITCAAASILLFFNSNMQLIAFL